MGIFPLSLLYDTSFFFFALPFLVNFVSGPDPLRERNGKAKQNLATQAPYAMESKRGKALGDGRELKVKEKLSDGMEVGKIARKEPFIS